MKRLARDHRGFTLVEVLIALSLLGVTMATVAALFSSGMKLRRATREHLAFQRDVRLFVEAVRDDLAHLVPAGPVPMVTADSIVLWRQQRPPAGPSLVTYQWSGSADQDSLLVRVSTPIAVDVTDFAVVEHEFRRWARVFDATASEVRPLVREDEGARFGSRATLNGLTGSWLAFPSVRAVAWCIGDDPDGDDDGARRSRILIKLAATPWAVAFPIPDPAVRLALMPDDGAAVEAGFWLPVAVQVPVADATDPAEGGSS